MRGLKYPYKFSFTKKPIIKPAIFAIVLFVLLSAALIPQPAEASLWSCFSNPGSCLFDAVEFAAAGLISSVLGTILWALNWIGVALMLLATIVLKTTMSFVLAANYTPLSAAANSGVTLGWTIVRDFANAFFILVLIVIAIGSMLGLKIRGSEVNAKLLVPFFAVALLINFTPLITGLVIDVANILTKFFFDAAVGGVSDFFSTNPFVQNFGKGPKITGNIDTSIGIIFQYIIFLIFNLISSLVLLTMSALLMVRVLAIWLLVIFSPLAFLAYILPQTRQYFQKWWNQFLQWTLLPLPLGFFLWLSAIFLMGAGACDTAAPPVPVNVGVEETTEGYAAPVNTVLGDNNAFCKITINSLALGTLVVGMVVSFQTSAMGAGFIVNQAKNVRTGTMNWAKRRGKGAAGYVGERAGAPALGAAGDVASATGGVKGLRRTPLGKMLRAVGAKGQGAETGAYAQRVERAKNEAAKLNTLDQIRGRMTGEHDAPLLSQLLARGSKLNNEGMATMLEKNPQIQNQVKSLQRFAKTNPQIGDSLKEFYAKNPKYAADEERAAKGLHAGEINNISIPSLQSRGTQTGIMEGGALSGNNLTKAMKELEAGVPDSGERIDALDDAMTNWLDNALGSTNYTERIAALRSPKFKAYSPRGAHLANTIEGNPALQGIDFLGGPSTRPAAPPSAAPTPGLPAPTTPPPTSTRPSAPPLSTLPGTPPSGGFSTPTPPPSTTPPSSTVPSTPPPSAPSASIPSSTTSPPSSSTTPPTPTPPSAGEGLGEIQSTLRKAARDQEGINKRLTEQIGKQAQETREQISATERRERERDYLTVQRGIKQKRADETKDKMRRKTQGGSDPVIQEVNKRLREAAKQERNDKQRRRKENNPPQ